MPSIDKVLKVANYFGVSMDYICGLSDVENSAENATISAIKKCASLDEKGKRIVITAIENEIDRIETLNNKLSNIIPLQRSRQAVSAGRGIYLGAEDMEGMLVERNEYTAKTTFVVPVSGDSMEPLYHDGDLLLIGKATDVPIGEIGVFTVNGCGYVKKRGEDCLISLNEEYEPIPLNETVRCNGYVIGKLNAQWII